MKILFLLRDRQPLHTFRGGGQRSALIYKALKEYGDVELAVLIDQNQQYIENQSLDIPVHIIKRFYPKDTFINQLKIKFRNILFLFFKDKKLEKQIDDLIKNNGYDIILSRYLFPAVITNAIKYPNLIVDVDDLPHDQLLISNSRYLRRIIKRFIYVATKNRYKTLIKKIPVSFVSNPKQKEVDNQQILVNIPFNTPDVTSLDFTERQKYNCLYIGALDYVANYNSLLYFVKNIWPAVVSKNPNMIFNIVGKGLPEKIRNEIENVKNINLLGYVENLDKLFEENSIYISPVYHGTGTNIKILEALHYEIPIVASPLSLRGYEHFLKDRYNILIGENDNQFAEKIISIAEDNELQKKITKNGKNDLIKNGYDFNAFKEVIGKAIKTVTNITNN